MKFEGAGGRDQTLSVRSLEAARLLCNDGSVQNELCWIDDIKLQSDTYVV